MSKLPHVGSASNLLQHNNNNNTHGETVTVRTWTLHVLSIEVSVSDTVQTLKESIRDVFGTDTASQVLSCQGRVLHNHLLISECRLGRGSLVHLNMTAQSAASMRVFCPGGLAVADQLEAAPLSCHLFIFDMDDTLTRNGVLAPGIRPLLEKLLKDGHFLAIASFNRSAVELLRMNGIDHLFHVIACGWNVRSRKTQHIRHCFRVLGWTDETPRMAFFFDDQVDNIRDVRRELSPPGNVQAVFVSAVRQMPSLVAQALDSALQFERDRAASAAAAAAAAASSHRNSKVPTPPPPAVSSSSSSSVPPVRIGMAATNSNSNSSSLSASASLRRDSDAGSVSSANSSSSTPLPSPGSSLRRRIAAATAAAMETEEEAIAAAGGAGGGAHRALSNLKIDSSSDDLNSTGHSAMDTPKAKNASLLMSVTVSAKTHAATVGDLDTYNSGAASNSSRRGAPPSTTSSSNNPHSNNHSNTSNSSNHHQHHPQSKKPVPVLDGGASVEEDESGNSATGSRSCPNLQGFGLEFPDNMDFDNNNHSGGGGVMDTSVSTTSTSTSTSTSSSAAFAGGSTNTQRGSSSAADASSPIANKQQSSDKFHRASISSGTGPSVHPGTSESPSHSPPPQQHQQQQQQQQQQAVLQLAEMSAKIRAASQVSKSGSLVTSIASRARIAGTTTTATPASSATLVAGGKGLSAVNALRNSMQ